MHKASKIKGFSLSGLIGERYKMDFKATYFECWRRAWEFHKQFSNIPKNDAEWQEVVNTAEGIVKQYEGGFQCEFIRSLVLVVLNELERQDKRERQQEARENEKEIQS